MFSTNFLSEFVYCILNCYAHMNILQMEYAHYKCKLLLLLLLKHRTGRMHNNADALSRLRPAPELIRKLQQDAINTCSVTLNPSINIRDAQQQDASISKLRDLKLRNQPKPSVKQEPRCIFSQDAASLRQIVYS